MSKTAPPAPQCTNNHGDPALWREENHGNMIKVFCKKCGKWIGNRPAVIGKGK